ncbi:hypothetical protein SAMN05443661_10793 [Natronobacterium gregoryi]|uniref:Uncharacterized protein n=2 Tax=Natronobacterium gregoryi TaxID=44930 RepID=L0AE58_NATGS|nr:hypothetical protein Natgr_0077 [Natronobacterium gregoryi SP2]SFI85872.1 hypothetical protein SAMN05443661_10793 [Natronobacterium gregoryi]
MCRLQVVTAVVVPICQLEIARQRESTPERGITG